MAGRRIVLTTFGSLGDLHPFIAVAAGLKARGHRPVLLSAPWFRERVESAGVEFRPLGPDQADYGDLAALVRRVVVERRGLAFLIGEVIMPRLRAYHADTRAVAQDADLLVSHSLTYATPVVAEELRKPWVGVALQPTACFSRLDPPAFAGFPMIPRPFRPALLNPAFRLAGLLAGRMAKPVAELRRSVGLPPGRNPVMAGQYSPDHNQAWFSCLAEPQPDWPPGMVQTGFPFHDGGGGLSPELAGFLDAGPPPVVFTLGSSAVLSARHFYRESVRAAVRLGVRAVLLVGDDPRNQTAGPLPNSILAADYAPYSQLFPRAAAVVHSGGVGTTAQALRAGVPMLVVPFANDQPDNAARITRRGLGRTLTLRKYRARRAAAELHQLLTRPAYAAKAQAVGTTIRGGDGVAAACRDLERILDGR